MQDKQKQTKRVKIHKNTGLNIPDSPVISRTVPQSEYTGPQPDKIAQQTRQEQEYFNNKSQSNPKEHAHARLEFVEFPDHEELLNSTHYPMIINNIYYLSKF